MSPVLLAVALGACVLVAGIGVALVADRPVAARFPELADARERRRDRPRTRSPITAAVDLAGGLLSTSTAGLLGTDRLARWDRVIDAAGRPPGLTPERLAGRKAAYTVLLGAAGSIFIAYDLWWPLVALPVAGWFLPDLDLKGKARERQEEITRALPDFLDVLSVTVSAGLDFRAALGRVADSFDGPLSDEVRTALRQMLLGQSRRAALTDLRRRNTSESLGEFVTALQQAEDLGAPLTGALNDIAGDVRRSYAQRARRTAAKVEPRLSVLTTLTLIPAAMLVVGVGFWVTNEIDLGGLLGG